MYILRAVLRSRAPGTQVLRANLLASGDSLTVGDDQTVDALTLVTLTASGAASASWSQVSGPTVTVTPTGALTATFTSPASLTGAVVVARATAASATADTTVTALPHGDWSWDGTAWRGFTIR